MRLIDADLMEKHIMGSKVFNQYFKELVQPLIWVENTVDASPVVRSEWILKIINDRELLLCPNCLKTSLIKSKFCPNCGADMREMRTNESEKNAASDESENGESKLTT